MKFSFDSVALMLIGLFGIIGGIVNKGWGLGSWTRYRFRNKNTDKDMQQVVSIIFGILFLLIGFALLRQLNVH